MKLHATILILFTALWTGFSYEGNYTPLRGEVLQVDTGEAIPGATILIQETNHGTAADSEGRFMFDNLPHGSYTLTIRAVGFVSVSKSIEHPEDGFLTIEMQQNVFRAEDVIVTSSPLGRNIHYQPAQSINAEKLQRNAAPSLGEILNGNPGVTTRSFGSAPARPVIRGLDGDRVLVMQNGERMGDLSGTAVDHAVGLDPLSMDRVEVIRGPASLMYGSGAIGGVVNMFSNDMPREWKAGTRANIASHVSTVNRMGAGLISAQHGGEQFAATGRMIYRSGGDLQTPEGRLPDTAIDNHSFGVGAGYRTGGFETGVSITGMNYAYGLPEAIDDIDESIEIRMNRFNIQSISTLEISGFFDHAELRFHYTDYGHDEINIERLQPDLLQEEVEISFDQQTLSSSLVLRHRPLGTLEGAVGLSFNTSQINVGGADALTPNASGYFLAGFLYEEISLSRQFTLKTGLRMEWKETFVKPNELFPDEDDFEDRSDLVFSGALGLNYTPNASWTAGIQVARAYRTPTIEELYSFAPHSAAGSFDVGNPTLQNEFSIGTDLFIEHRNERFRGELSLFANRMDNFVDFSPMGTNHVPSGLPFFEYRSKDAVLYGFELSTELMLTQNFIAAVGFDYVRGQERTGDRNNLTFIPPFRTQMQMMYDNGTLWTGPRVRIVNRQEKTAPNEDPTDGYLLIGADAGYRFGHGFTFSLRLDNLLNESYRDHLSRVENRDAPMPGRNLNAMLRWEF